MSNYIYDHKYIGSTRKVKWCDSCGKEIPKGDSSITVTYYTDDGFNNADVCSEKCLQQYTKDFNNEEE